MTDNKPIIKNIPKGFKPVFKGVPPFMPYEKGFGYQGVLLEEEESGKLQCHLCSSLANNLSKHLHHKHKEVSPKKYREMTGLNLTTPLMSEQTRKKVKNNFLNLTEEKQKEVIARLLSNNRKVHKTGKYRKKGKYSSTEFQNRFGTCPEQLKTRFWDLYHKLGKIPTTEEMDSGLRHVIFDRFNSYKEALITFGISLSEYNQYLSEGKLKAHEARKENDFFPKYTEEEVRSKYQDFYTLNGRLPTWGEVKQNGLPGRIPFMRVFKTNKSNVEGQLRIK